MEKHIFKFGSGSNAIILPKKWIEKNKLKSSDTVFLSENNRGELVLSSKLMPNKTFVKIIDKSTDWKLLSRFVGLYYINGITKLTIRSKDTLTEKQVSEIQKQIRNECPGFEIINQSNNEIQIEDFTSIRDIDIDKILSRIRSLILQEFVDVKLKNLNAVVQIEELVDRFYMLAIRYINIVQPSDMIKYYKTVILFDNIADNLLAVVPSMNKINMDIIDKLSEIFEKSDKGFRGDQKTIVEIAAAKNDLKAQIDKLKVEKLYKRLLREIAKYSSQIAEFGLLEKDKSLEIF
ncbi:MAG: hypothetical protein ABR981_03030 [Candidatus Micrarchaeaceae archaeon]|jgi:phosphate uptake regulator